MGINKSGDKEEIFCFLIPSGVLCVSCVRIIAPSKASKSQTPFPSPFLDHAWGGGHSIREEKLPPFSFEDDKPHNFKKTFTTHQAVEGHRFYKASLNMG